MHDPGVVILTLTAGGVLLLVAERSVAARATVWWALAAAVLLVAGGLSLSSSASPFETLRTTGFRAAAALVWTTGLLLCLVSAQHEGDRDDARHAGGRAGLLLLMIAGTLACVAGATLGDLWMGLELIAFAGLSLRRLEAASEDALDDHRGFSREAAAGVMATLLIAVGFSLGGGSLDSPVRIAGPVVQSTGEGYRTSLPPVPNPAGNSRRSMALSCVIASLGMRLMAAPFHLPLWQSGPFRSFGDHTAWLVLARGAVLVAWARYVILSPNVQAAGVLLTGVTAAASLGVGSLLLTRETGLRSSLSAAAMIQSGFVLAGLAAVGWIATQPDLAPPGGLVTLVSNGWVAALVAEGAVLWGIGVVYSALRSPDRTMETLEDLRGLGRNAPLACGLLCIFVAGLAGLPLTGTFWGRLLVAGSAWSVRRDVSGAAGPTLHPAAVALAVMVLMGWLALGGYALRVIWLACWRRAVCRHTLASRWLLLLAGIVGMALAIGGVWPQLLLRN